jgi:hypothetical protein
MTGPSSPAVTLSSMALSGQERKDIGVLQSDAMGSVRRTL